MRLNILFLGLLAAITVAAPLGNAPRTAETGEFGEFGDFGDRYRIKFAPRDSQFSAVEDA